MVSLYICLGDFKSTQTYFLLIFEQEVNLNKQNVFILICVTEEQVL
jgi:hypothetical protein